MPPPRGARPMNREDFKKNPISKGLVKKLMSYTTGKYKALLGIVILCIIVASVTSVLGNMFIKNLIDDYIVPILKTKTETGNADFSGLLNCLELFKNVAHFSSALLIRVKYNVNTIRHVIRIHCHSF